MRANKLQKRVLLKVQFSNAKQQYILDAENLKPFINKVDPTSFKTDKDELIREIMNMQDFIVITESDGTTVTLKRCIPMQAIMAKSPHD